MNGIDWDKIEGAVLAYGRYCEDRVFTPPSPQQTARFGFEATMVKIHNEIRKAQDDD